MPPVEVIKAVTLHAAMALDLHDDRGSLSIGKRADIAIFDVTGYNELLYRMGSNLLTDVIVKGKAYHLSDLQLT
jgi:imidazolonepropionase